MRVYYIVNGVKTESQKFRDQMSYPFKSYTNKLKKWNHLQFGGVN